MRSGPGCNCESEPQEDGHDRYGFQGLEGMKEAPAAALFAASGLPLLEWRPSEFP
jgi:hypothetical protein